MSGRRLKVEIILAQAASTLSFMELENPGIYQGRFRITSFLVLLYYWNDLVSGKIRDWKCLAFSPARTYSSINLRKTLKLFQAYVALRQK